MLEFCCNIYHFSSSENPEKFVKLHSKHPITDLKYLDIGLGHQSLRFEFDEDCASYSFLIRDEYICRNFINVLLGKKSQFYFFFYNLLK